MKLLALTALFWASITASGAGTLYVDSNTINADGTGATIVPVGFIGLWSGGISTNFDSTGKGTNSLTHTLGWALCNGQNGTPDLRNAFVKGIGDSEEVGGTGGAATHTPAGTVAAPTISGSTASESSHTHSVTAAGTVTITNSTTGITVAMSGTTAAEASHTHSVTASGLVTITNSTVTGTIAWPAGVPTFTGTAPQTTNVQTIAAGSTARLVATNAAATPAGTVAWPAGVPTFASSSPGPTNAFVGSAVTSGAGSSHSHAVGSLAAGVTDPQHNHTNSFAGSAVTSAAGSAHSHGAGTLAASIPAFTGSSANTEPAYVKLAYIQKQ